MVSDELTRSHTRRREVFLVDHVVTNSYPRLRPHMPPTARTQRCVPYRLTPIVNKVRAYLEWSFDDAVTVRNLIGEYWGYTASNHAVTVVFDNKRVDLVICRQRCEFRERERTARTRSSFADLDLAVTTTRRVDGVIRPVTNIFHPRHGLRTRGNGVAVVLVHVVNDCPLLSEISRVDGHNPTRSPMAHPARFFVLGVSVETGVGDHQLRTIAIDVYVSPSFQGEVNIESGDVLVVAVFVDVQQIGVLVGVFVVGGVTGIYIASLMKSGVQTYVRRPVVRRLGAVGVPTRSSECAGREVRPVHGDRRGVVMVVGFGVFAPRADNEHVIVCWVHSQVCCVVQLGNRPELPTPQEVTVSGQFDHVRPVTARGAIHPPVLSATPGFRPSNDTGPTVISFS